jgi:hypothetical protein
MVRSRILLAIVFLTAFHGWNVLACSCYGPRTPAGGYAASNLIFTGTVRKKVDRATFFRRAWTHVQEIFGEQEFTIDRAFKTEGFLVAFDVQRMWRGLRKARVEVFTGRGGGDCGIPFQVGKQYLVYARCGPDGDCFTTVCGRTARIEEASEDLRYLASKPAVR